MQTRPDLLNMGPVKDLYELADRLDMMPANDDDTAEAGFDMEAPTVGNSSDHPCGTAGCIGGWVAHWQQRNCGPERAVCDLGVKWHEARKICFPSDDHPAWEATPQQAARAVRILADTGKTDWDRAMQEVPA